MKDFVFITLLKNSAGGMGGGGGGGAECPLAPPPKCPATALGIDND